MNIKEMHYDFKMKLNKLDSQQYKNLRIPEIDWVLNEAAELFVKMVAEPRLRSHLGFEKSQRNIDDIRTLVTDVEVAFINDVATLPTDYMYYLRGRVAMIKNCTKLGILKIKQHDDEYEISPFDTSSFEWGEVNGVFKSGGIVIEDANDFTVTSLKLSYIKQIDYMHDAEDFPGGTYNTLSGVALGGPGNPGTQDCILPNQTHREVIDIAVLLVTGQLQMPDYQVKLAKLSLNNLK